MKHLGNLLFISFLTALSPSVDAQDAWKKIMLNGKITFHSISTTIQYDDDGEVIGRTESERNGSTAQFLAFYPGRFQLMAKVPAKLKEFNEANIHHIFQGETHDSKKMAPIFFPVTFSSAFKEWGKCAQNEDLILIKSYKGNGTSNNTASKSHLTMIQTRTQGDVDMDKAVLEGLRAFGQKILDQNKAQDAKDGKTIHESDYFMPASLYNNETYGLYLFTNWWTAGDFNNLPIANKNKDYDCTSKKWLESTGSPTAIQLSDDNRVLLEDYDEEENSGRFRYISIPPAQMETFIKEPTRPTTFIGGSHRIIKDDTTETETKEIIIITVSKAD